MSAAKLLRILVSAGLLAWVLWQTPWIDVSQAFAALRIRYWLAALGVLLGAQLVSTLRWQMFAQALRFDVPLLRMLGYYFIGMFFNQFLPTSVGGDVVRGWYLNGGTGRKLAAYASVFLDRLNGLLVLMALACVGVLLAPPDLPAWIPVSVWSVAGCGVLGMLTLPALLWTGLLPQHRDRQLRTMLGVLKTPHTLVGATLLSLIVQIASVTIVWLIGTGLNAPVPATYYWILTPMVSLITLLPSIGGTGVRETAMVLFLAPLGIESGLALTLSFLWFFVSVAAGLLGGVVYFVGAFPQPQAAADPAGGEESIRHGPITGNPDQGRTGQLDQAA